MEFSVVDLASLGGDVPDLLIGRHGIACLVEVKSEEQIKRRNQGLSSGQQSFAQKWRGPPVIVALTLVDVLNGFNSLLRK